MAKFGVLEVACPGCGMTQMLPTKWALNPDPDTPAKCRSCQEALASGDTAVLLAIQTDVRKTSKWVTFMGVVVMVGLVVNGIIFLAIAAAV